jgi:pSer/pThr/pTyr-binding forkhead associated (FHA) protein
MTFGRADRNDVVLTSLAASRFHAELRPGAGGYILHDRGSSGGTWVNGIAVTSHQLKPGDEIVIGTEAFRFELAGAQARTREVPVLRVTVTGGGPVGLSFALLLEHLMGPRVAIKAFDGRWMRDGDRVVWKTADQGNVRRQQVVTIQSRHFSKLPQQVQERLFVPAPTPRCGPR